MKLRLPLVFAFLAILALFSLVMPREARPVVQARGLRWGPQASSTETSTPVGRAYLPLVVGEPRLNPSPSTTATVTATATASPSATATASPTPSSTPQAGPQVPSFNHIFTIVLENQSYERIIGNTASAPFINSLAQQYGLATNYYATTHPSLPNYISLIGGDTFGIHNDCMQCFVDAPNLVDQLEGAGKSWNAYMENMPSPCFIGDSGTLYRQKHNPFIYFNDIRLNPARCNKIVPFTRFASDLQANTLPDYVWIGPNMCSDMHDCPIKDGDAWLKTWVTKILASPAWQQNSALFITWDEGRPIDNSGCCQYASGGHIVTLAISPLAANPRQSSVAYDHYSLLRTIEEAWGLPLLGNAACACSPPMTDFFSATPARSRP